MKKYLLPLAVILPTLIFSQENKTVVKETVTKRVITKEGSNVSIKEEVETKKEKGEIKVEEIETRDIPYAESIEAKKENEITKDQQLIDQENKALVEAEKKRQEQALINSKKEADEKAAQEKKLLEDKKAALIKEMEENKKKLEKRSKGMVKLKKDN